MKHLRVEERVVVDGIRLGVTSSMEIDLYDDALEKFAAPWMKHVRVEERVVVDGVRIGRFHGELGIDEKRFN